jgi:hypothetical protein
VLAREVALVPGLQARLHDIDVRAWTEKHEAVAQRREQREEDHPDRPESTTGAGGDPYADADQRQGDRAAGLVHQPPAKLRLALHQRELGGKRTDWKIGTLSIKVGAGTSRVDRLQALLVLLCGKTTRNRVLVQLLDQTLTLGVGYAYLARIGHIQNVVGVASWFMSAEDDFDLSAAGLRADGSDLRISVAVLASKLESSLPARTRVERRGSGLLGRGEKQVRRVEVNLGETSYELTIEGDRVQGSRERKVGGIAIKREQLDPGQWVSELAAQLREEAERSAEARTALERLMG